MPLAESNKQIPVKRFLSLLVALLRANERMVHNDLLSIVCSSVHLSLSLSLLSPPLLDFIFAN
jgi:hypothetical protein